MATPKQYPDSTPVVLRIDADTEEEARAAFCGWNMVFRQNMYSDTLENNVLQR
ncbi:host cell division inhibitor Icd-like protein [Klebsiella pneumoniae]|uniref:host cell division inhibitor Icd-like protein n=1 Tax=Klebsiella pneumoniae TaxID=573 RepID=UPI000FD762A7|nr:host cell division inhibitor Icd-like protein [Klebsiella pneumoniae]